MNVPNKLSMHFCHCGPSEFGTGMLCSYGLWSFAFLNALSDIFLHRHYQLFFSSNGDSIPFPSGVNSCCNFISLAYSHF